MRIASLEERLPAEAGGKARGLARLHELGFAVPRGFVLILPAAEAVDAAGLAPHLSRLGAGRKAVRSSAVGEDGARASFAGQFETVLGVEGAEAVAEAARRCLAAGRGERVQSYARGRGAGADLRLSIVVQDLVEARWSGVAFSADPVSGRRDLAVVNAVAGLGDRLVDGRADAQVFRVHETGARLEAPPEGLAGDERLPDALCDEVLAGVRRLEQALGAPVDCEWAVDAGGRLQWLQARPITTLPEVHWNELDTGARDPALLWTLSNVGEMLPGAITPLTISVSAWAIDRSIQVLTRASGAQRGPAEDFRYMGVFYNRFFFNVSALYDLARHVAMNEKDGVELSITGRLIPEGEVRPEGTRLGRAWNFVKQLAAIARPVAHLQKLAALVAAQRRYHGHDPAALHQALDDGRVQLAEAFGHHLLVSAWSGTLYTAMLRVLTANARPVEPDDHRVAAQLLGAIDGIAGAEAVRALDELGDRLAEAPALAARFLQRFDGGDAALAAAVLAGAPYPVGPLWARFVAEHGHRCVRESELSEQPWRDDPGPPLALLRTGLGERLAGGGRRSNGQAARVATPAPDRPSLDRGQRIALAFMLPQAREAVARREQSKSLSIKFLDGLRRGYRRLAEVLVERGRLPDAALAFYCTHDELGILAHAAWPALVERAQARRRQQPELAALDFHDLGKGVPVPIEPHRARTAHQGALWGVPVSAGVVEGPVRVVRTVEQSRAVRPGEVLVAPFTDVGWTPCFPVIAGLVTELGSPLSHGAVVAREYGLPAVVSVRGATTALRTGERVRLDGVRGVVERLEPAPAADRTDA